MRSKKGTELFFIAVICYSHDAEGEQVADSIAYERVTRNLTVESNLSPFLDFDESADSSVVADLAAVEIHKVENLYVPAELDVRRYSS